MEEKQFILNFEGISAAEANKFAGELKPLLQSVTAQATIKSAQAEDNSQDFGATLIIGILGTPAIIALSKKIGDWLIKRSSGSITIKTKDGGEFVAENLKSKDVAKLAEKWIEKYENKS